MENTTYRKARGRIRVTSEEAEAEGYVKRNKITEDDLKPDSHVSACDVNFSTGAPVISFDTVYLGHSNVASSYAYRNQPWEAQMVNFHADVNADVPFLGGSTRTSYQSSVKAVFKQLAQAWQGLTNGQVLD